MAALTQKYVDPSLNSNTGTGTDVDPFGDLQYALNTMTRDGTHGDQINVKAGTAEVLAAVISYTSYIAVTSPSAIAPLVIRGYTSTANDGGVFEVDANGGAAFPLLANVHIIDGYIHNGGSSTLVDIGGGGIALRLRVENTTGIGIRAGASNSAIHQNNVSDCGTGIELAGTCSVIGNYLKFGGTRNFTHAIRHAISGISIIARNIISVGTSGNGIEYASNRATVMNNSIFANGSTGAGIRFSGATQGEGTSLLNNVVEGFSGAGGSGFSFATATSVPLRYAGNAAYNNTTDYALTGDVGIIEGVDNETLSASPFAKTGSDTFANRFAYFAPVDTGNIRGGAIQ